MLRDGKIIVGMNADGEYVSLLPKMANRHGLIAGATGTGKTVTLKVMAEAFSSIGVPVFIADVKGDVAGLYKPGDDNENMQRRIERFRIGDIFQYQGFPVTLWDIYGRNGVQLRTTVSEMGPLLLSRILRLNDTQTDVLTVAFNIADDNNMLLIDTKDLKALLNYIAENRKAFMADYGNITEATIATIVRAIVTLDSIGGKTFFGEPALWIHDWLQTEPATGKGVINILDSSTLINDGRLYSTFMLWLLSELFEELPEVGDLEKPKAVFFFDEAHLLFNDAPKVLLEKIEQVVKLIRSKGIGIYFCTQNPRDIPNGVLAQLSNKVQHGLRAFTPAEKKAVKAAAESFRENAAFKTYDTILELGTGEAVVSFLQADGTPGIAQKTSILPPQSNFGALDDATRGNLITSSIYYEKYAVPVDNYSAYERLNRIAMQTGLGPIGIDEAEIEMAEMGYAEPEVVQPVPGESVHDTGAYAAPVYNEAVQAGPAAAPAGPMDEKELEIERLKAELARMEAEKARVEAERLEAERRKAEEARIKAESEDQIARIEQEKLAAAEAKAAAEKAKAEEKAAKAAEKEAAKLAAAEERKRKQMSNAVGGTVGREVGRTVGGMLFGKFGRKLGGNLGAQLGRNILGTFTATRETK